MKRLIVRVISLIVLVCVVLSFFASCGEKKEENGAGDYLRKIIEKSFDKSLSTPQYDSLMTEIVYNPTVDDPFGVGLEARVYSNIFGEAVSIINLNGMGSSADLSLYSGGNNVIIASDIFPHKAYGMTTTEFEAILNSFGGDESVSSLFFGANYNAFVSAFENNAKKIEKTAKKYLEFFVDCLGNATEESVTEGEDITVEVRFNSDCAKKLIKDIFTEMKKDKELRQLLSSVLTSAQLSGDELDEILSEYDAIFEDDTVLDGIFDEINENAFSVSLKVESDKQFNARKVLLSLSLNDGTDLKYELDITSENNVVLKLTVEEKTDGQTVISSIVYSVKTTDTDDKLSTEIKVDTTLDDSETSVSYKLDWNKVVGDYTVSAVSPNQTLIASGKMTVNETEQSITITKAEITEEGTNGEGQERLNYSFNLDLKIRNVKNEKLPSFPMDYKQIMELNNNDINNILSEVYSNPIISKLMELMQTTGPDGEGAMTGQASIV